MVKAYLPAGLRCLLALGVNHPKLGQRKCIGPASRYARVPDIQICGGKLLPPGGGPANGGGSPGDFLENSLKVFE